MNHLIHYDFRIDTWQPDTLPMARLAEYLAKLSLMFGYKEQVHFVKVRKGSAIPEFAVEQSVAAQVAARLRLVGTPDAPPELKRAHQDINALLRQDNASARLNLKHGENILIFQGQKMPLAEEVVVYEQGNLDGVVIRVGGKDDSVPVWIEGENKLIYKCQANRDIARQLAAYLFDCPVRVIGNGQWCRTIERQWVLQDFNIKGFEVLEDIPLTTIVSALRQIKGNAWNEMLDPQAELRKLRES